MSALRRMRVVCPALLSVGTLLAFTLLSPIGSASGAAISNKAALSAGVVAAAEPSVAGAFVPVAPARLLDTRTGLGARKAPVKPDTAVAVQVTGRGGVPGSGVSAVVLNVTVTGPTAAGHITAYADGASRPGVRNVNFVRGQTVANLVVVRVGADGKVDLFNASAGTTNLLAGIEGYYLSGAPSVAGAFVPVAPARLLDTRTGLGARKAPVKPDTAVVLNVTVTGPTAAGHITAYADGASRPGVRNVNFVRGQTVANLVVVRVGADGKVDLFNASAGTTNLLAGIEGYYLTGTTPISGCRVAGCRRSF